MKRYISAAAVAHEEEKKAVKEEKPQRVPDLSEEEKSQVRKMFYSMEDFLS